jgi:hypothetical protein
MPPRSKSIGDENALNGVRASESGQAGSLPSPLPLSRDGRRECCRSGELVAEVRASRDYWRARLGLSTTHCMSEGTKTAAKNQSGRKPQARPLFIERTLEKPYV